MSESPNRWLMPLPAKPNWEHQKKLAKQLLRQLWGNDPDATERLILLHPKPPQAHQAKLSDAQLVIARGYGFTSWAMLKSKIESLSLTPLEQWINAVKAGDVQQVRKLFDQHPELDDHANDRCFAFDSTALFAAKPNWELVDLLIAHGADVNLKTGWWAGGYGLAENETLEIAQQLFSRGVAEDIWTAVGLDHHEKVRQLLADDPTLVTAPGGDGCHPLHYAQSVEMVDLLVGHGADIHARDVDHTSTPAQYQIQNHDVVRRLLEMGAKVDVFMAAALGDLNLINQCAIDEPACVSHRLGIEPWSNSAGGMIYNWKLGHGLTPMDVAVKLKHDDAHALLLQLADPKDQLLDAAWRGDVTRGRQLLADHPRLLDTMTDDDHGALNRACWWYRPDAVRAMLSLGFNRHVEDDEKMMPLDRAAFHGHVQCLQWLLDGDPAPPLEHKHQYEGTPLQTCIHGALHGWQTGHHQDHAACVEALLNAGAKFEYAWLPTGSDAIDQVLRKAHRLGC
ncbi:MAG: ankyrin repeat domain-containing protein [Phycisphaeraceae bacterium JB051]